MRKTYKKIIALCAVLIFALALIPIQSFAIGDPFSATIGFTGASGGGLFGSMAVASGFNVSFSSGTSIDTVDSVWDDIYAGVHVGAGSPFSGEKGQITESDPETGIPTVYDYITVNLQEWLDLQTDYVSSFCTNYNVIDNSSGQQVKQYIWDGIIVNTLAPWSNASSTYFAGYFSNCNYPSTAGTSTQCTFGKGTFTITCNSISNNVGNFTRRMYYNGTLVYNSNTSLSMDSLPTLGLTYGRTTAGYLRLCFWNFNPNASPAEASLDNLPSSSTSVNWTSNTLNLGAFNNWTAPRVKIPASSWSPSDPVQWTIQEFLSELSYKMNNGAGDDIILDDADNPPVPPVPIPSTPLGDIPVDEWYDLFGLPVLEGQEQIHQDLQDFSSDVSDGIDDVIGELEDIESDVESIDTNLGIGNGLLGDLKSIGQSIQSTLSSILSGVTDLVQEIVLSTETFIAGLLNSIIGGLGGWLSTMREAFSIWHYVVEWVGSISTVFSWFWSVAGSTSYYIQLPIYASLAGAVVLAFYKRFGK